MKRKDSDQQKASKRKYGNMISGGEVSGKNFLMKETLSMPRKEWPTKRKTETIDGFRLFNNLLSASRWHSTCSTPDATIIEAGSGNGHTCREVSSGIFRYLRVTEIGLEYIPTPIENYTKDKSAMDAYIRFMDNKGGKHIIAIETKYTDVLGMNEGQPL